MTTCITPDTGVLILADLDRFKTVNDTYAHAAGEPALQRFAEACTATVRPTDLVGRYGGEEFILLLPGASVERAEMAAEEISRRLAAFPTDGGIGNAHRELRHYNVRDGTSDVRGLINAADKAM